MRLIRTFTGSAPGFCIGRSDGARRFMALTSAAFFPALSVSSPSPRSRGEGRDGGLWGNPLPRLRGCLNGGLGEDLVERRGTPHSSRSRASVRPCQAARMRASPESWPPQGEKPGARTTSRCAARRPRARPSSSCRSSGANWTWIADFTHQQKSDPVQPGQPSARALSSGDLY